MAFPKKGTKTILVGGKEYRYKQSKYDEYYNYTLYVQANEHPKSFMCLTVSHEIYLSQYRIVSAIEQALKAGWKPDSNGNLFALRNFEFPKHVWHSHGFHWVYPSVLYRDGKPMKDHKVKALEHDYK